MDVKEFLDQEEIRDLIAENDLEAVYLNLAAVERADLSEYLLNLGIDPIDYFRNNIPVGAFFSCAALEKVTIPNGLTSISEHAFSHCPNLTSVVIPDSVTTIDKAAFSSSYNLADVTFGENSQLTAISPHAFYGCSSLKSITIPNIVTTISNYAFEHCSSLTSVVIPNSVASIGYAAFYNCGSLTDVYYTGTEEQWKAIIVAGYNFALSAAKIHFNS